jgi:hypothetical protein
MRTRPKTAWTRHTWFFAKELHKLFTPAERLIAVKIDAGQRLQTTVKVQTLLHEF